MADKLINLFADVLLVEPSTLSDASSPATVAEWDSTANMMLVAALEETFEVELTTGEIESMKTIGKVREVLRTRDAALV